MQSTQLRKIRDKFPIVSAKPGKNCVTYKNKTVVFNTLFTEYYIKRLSTEECHERIVEMIKERYDLALKYNMDHLNSIFQYVYGKADLSPNRIGEIIIKLKDIKQETGKEFVQIVQEIKSYLGKQVSFWRMEQGQMVRVNSDRILSAYYAVQNKETFENVRNKLYL